MDLNTLTIEKLRHGYENKEFCVTEVVEAHLARIEEDTKLNAFITVAADESLKVARLLDEKIVSQEALLPLTGVPIAHKDVFVTKGIKTTAGSKILDNYIPEYDATVVTKLENSGTVLLGKTNCDEFAQGTTGENSAFGATLNPWDDTRVAGGSSSGSAAAVAWGMCLVATGSDTGGSVRTPASFCGVYGLKPTYGRISRYGLIPMASSFDCPGLLARDLNDLKEVYTVMSGKDPRDSTSRDDFTFSSSDAPLKIGLPRELWEGEMDPQIKSAVEQRISDLGSRGVEFISVSLPSLEYALASYYILVPAEVSSNLARFDGVHYGNRVEGALRADDMILQSRTAFLGPEVKRRIILGTFVLSAGYYDQYYAKAMQARALLREDFLKVWSQVDLLVSPVTPHFAPKLGQLSDPLTMYREDVMTLPANLAGVPALSIPLKVKDSLPIGLQAMASWGGENLLFELARLVG